jgi:hypothetical protein
MGPVPASRRPSRAVVVVLLGPVLALGTVGCTGSREADLGRPAASVAPEDTRDRAAVALVEQVQGALTDGPDAADGVPTADDRARAELGAAAANVRVLRLRSVGLRYLAPSTTSLTQSEQGRYGDSAWVGDVQVSWEQPGVDRRPSLLTVPVVLSGQDADPRFVSFRTDAADRAPLWLLTRLAVVRGARSVAVAPDPASARRLSRLAERAVTAVRRTLPRWRDRLLVQETATQRDFQVAAGLPAQQARAVAAVTTTADGSGDAEARGQVFVNPRLYDPLGEEGRQIVVSHEAAHVALGAATSRLPLWLSEGMADWIALRTSPLPVDRLAGQVLDWVRDKGGPRALPGPEAFDGSDRRIGAWYEAAWLAVRRLGETYGAERLLRFYRASAAAGSTEEAFRSVLGTTEAAFTRDWRAYLADLA